MTYRPIMFTADQHDRLRAIAQERGVPISTLARQIVDEYLCGCPLPKQSAAQSLLAQNLAKIRLFEG